MPWREIKFRKNRELLAHTNQRSIRMESAREGEAKSFKRRKWSCANMHRRRAAMRLPMGKRSCAAVPKRQIAQNVLNAFMPLPFERLCRVHCHFGKDSVQIAQNAFLASAI